MVPVSVLIHTIIAVSSAILMNIDDYEGNSVGRVDDAWHSSGREAGYTASKASKFQRYSYLRFEERFIFSPVSK